MKKRGYRIMVVLFSSIISGSCIGQLQEIKFEYLKNQIIIPVYINNKEPYNFLFDTGVDPSVIDFNILKDTDVQIDSTDFGKAQGRGTDDITVFPTRIKKLTLDNENYSEIDALAMDLSHLGEPLGIRLHGILGYSFLSNKIFKIDYKKRIIRFFYSRLDLDATSTGQKYIAGFFYDGEDKIPLVDKFLINGKKFVGSIDTGSSLNIQIYDHFLYRYKISIDSTHISEIVGARGRKQTYKSVVETFKVGNFNFSNQETTISSIKDKNQLRQGNIGNRFLQNFKVGFDYQNNEIIFEEQ